MGGVFWYVNVAMVDEKRRLRERVWGLLEGSGVAAFPLPCWGRIPNFRGVEEASRRILELEEFREVQYIFAAPDWVLKPARALVLRANKGLVVATPHMKEFLVLEGVKEGRIDEAVTIRGFSKFGKKLAVDKLSGKVGLFLQGSVVVDSRGNRLGKGRGYGDREYWFLRGCGVLSENCKVVTVVHDLQVVEDFSCLMSDEDVRVDYILTPGKVIVVGQGSRGKVIEEDCEDE